MSPTYFTEPTSLRECLLLLAAGVLVLFAILGGVVAVLSWWTL